MISRAVVGRIVVAAVAVVVVGIMVATTTYVSGDTPAPSGSGTGQGLDPQTWAEENFDSQVVPAIQDKAQPWADLIAAIQADPEAAGQQYGTREAGANSYSYAVTITGTLGEGKFGELAIQADGTPQAVTVGVQIGPGLTGSSLRDACGLVTFGMFTNQTAYQQVGVQLNNLVKQEVLASFDATAALGQAFTITGAFTWTGDGHASIVAVSIEGPQ
jgi:predicted lipoprotein